MDITVQELAPFGAEITGINLGQINLTETANVAFKFKHLLADHGVVVLRRQDVDDAEFVSFLKWLGPLMFTAGEQPVPNQPWLNVVSNIGRDRPPRSVFHTDTSYVAQPPAYTALKAISLPESGGETLFSNQYCAFETLPMQIQQKLSRATVLHTASGVELDDQENQAWHPLFQRHPISGKVALFLSTPERCRAIEGFNSQQGQRAIRLLYQHSIRRHRLYRHSWQNGDIVIWDNRCTMHRADHSGVIGDRVLHRGLVASKIESELRHKFLECDQKNSKLP